ncbi:hypothetical protein OCK74_10690 [Chitinophagaceae bacterium LB-8]|uniref:Uncharacterized protein n=1 Tax=Paraflavisolibacter caeni TaxID=2982496 RepID=A0A9X2XP05_9BACT|nr:hypothetical protein [Paraflavisolibacter caeni]MCU7549584.1 hypothetical protein [Paraflavisolibacter caeni]
MRLLTALIFILVLLSCKESNHPPNATAANSSAKNESLTTFKDEMPVELYYYKCDYSKNQFITILSSGTKDTTTEVWGIDKRDIEELPIIELKELDSGTIIKKAEAHLKKRFPGMSLQLSGFQVESITDNDTSNSRNKFVEVTFQYNKRGYYQIVPLLSDGRIILSNNE